MAEGYRAPVRASGASGVFARESRVARLARVYAVGGLPRRLAYAFVDTSAVWLYGAAVLLGVSLFGAWLRIPLIGTWKSWTLPIDIGWGLRADPISYGALATLLAVFFCWQGALASDWISPSTTGLANLTPAIFCTRRIVRSSKPTPVPNTWRFTRLAITLTLVANDATALRLARSIA